MVSPRRRVLVTSTSSKSNREGLNAGEESPYRDPDNDKFSTEAGYSVVPGAESPYTERSSLYASAMTSMHTTGVGERGGGGGEEEAEEISLREVRRKLRRKREELKEKSEELRYATKSRQLLSWYTYHGCSSSSLFLLDFVCVVAAYLRYFCMARVFGTCYQVSSTDEGCATTRRTRRACKQ